MAHHLWRRWRRKHDRHALDVSRSTSAASKVEDFRQPELEDASRLLYRKCGQRALAVCNVLMCGAHARGTFDLWTGFPT